MMIEKNNDTESWKMVKGGPRLPSFQIQDKNEQDQNYFGAFLQDSESDSSDDESKPTDLFPEIYEDESVLQCNDDVSSKSLDYMSSGDESWELLSEESWEVVAKEESLIKETQGNIIVASSISQRISNLALDEGLLQDFEFIFHSPSYQTSNPQFQVSSHHCDTVAIAKPKTMKQMKAERLRRKQKAKLRRERKLVQRNASFFHIQTTVSLELKQIQEQAQAQNFKMMSKCRKNAGKSQMKVTVPKKIKKFNGGQNVCHLREKRTVRTKGKRRAKRQY